MLVYFAIILIVLLGFCGLAIDTGRMELQQNRLQAAADIGALAAAGELWHGGPGSNYQTAANNDVAAYETANNIPSSGTPTTQISATYGPYVGDYSTVQVTVTQTVKSIFLGLLSSASASMTLTATAVAQIPPCMIFLGNPTANTSYDYWVASAGNQTLPSYSCPEYFKHGVVIDGFAHIAGSQVRSSGPASASITQGWTWWPVLYSVPAITDPLAYLTAPTAGSCVNASPISDRNQATGTTISFTPGTYCGKTATFTPGCGGSTSTITPAIDFEGSSTGGCNTCTGYPTANFAPGLYVFIGGANFSCATVAGTGVTMYFTKSNSVGFGQMLMTSSTWNVSAPTDATNNGLPGISIMNDRNWTGGVQDFRFVSSTWYADGVIYLTGTGIYDWQMSLSAPNYLNMVAANMYMFGANINPSANYASLSGGNPLHTVITLVQ